DGVSSEIRHICEASRVGAVIYKDQTVISRAMKNACALIHGNPFDFFLHGGEGYELLFTIAPSAYKFIMSTGIKCRAIGRIVPRSQGITLFKDNTRVPLINLGFRHFSK
ncbi:MAG: hypothetical protein ABIA63_14740, partial [bacterium]